MKLRGKSLHGHGEQMACLAECPQSFQKVCNAVGGRRYRRRSRTTIGKGDGQGMLPITNSHLDYCFF